MYEPILMSKASFERLDEAQQKALLNAGQKAEDYFFEAAKGLDVELVQAFEKAGVTVKAMSRDQFDQWLDLAKTSSYKVFAEEVPGGEELIKKALAVE
jgi:TRAP-type C4-dicarboxylate transport system substrate-binding protein